MISFASGAILIVKVSSESSMRGVSTPRVPWSAKLGEDDGEEVDRQVDASSADARKVSAAAGVFLFGAGALSFLHSRPQSRRIPLHGSPSALSGGGVGGSSWRASVLCAKRKR